MINSEIGRSSDEEEEYPSAKGTCPTRPSASPLRLKDFCVFLIKLVRGLQTQAFVLEIPASFAHMHTNPRYRVS